MRARPAPQRTAGARRRAAARVVIVLLAASLGGCVFLPVPTPKHGFGMIAPQTVAAIKPGATTRLDVLFLLGEPRSRFEADRAFVYEWQEAHGEWILLTAGGGGGLPIPSLRALAIRFGADGRVERLRQFGWSSRMGFKSFPKEDAREREIADWLGGAP